MRHSMIALVPCPSRIEQGLSARAPRSIGSAKGRNTRPWSNRRVQAIQNWCRVQSRGVYKLPADGEEQGFVPLVAQFSTASSRVEATALLLSSATSRFEEADGMTIANIILFKRKNRGQLDLGSVLPAHWYGIGLVVWKRRAEEAAKALRVLPALASAPTTGFGENPSRAEASAARSRQIPFDDCRLDMDEGFALKEVKRCPRFVGRVAEGERTSCRVTGVRDKTRLERLEGTRSSWQWSFGNGARESRRRIGLALVNKKTKSDSYYFGGGPPSRRGCHEDEEQEGRVGGDEDFGDKPHRGGSHVLRHPRGYDWYWDRTPILVSFIQPDRIPTIAIKEQALTGRRIDREMR
ncbi:hypothetical protein FA13DRAFT_1711083 [Coprinellus micaceus]|uniref:Uncharacterized protein n=1 Tax=Coprinellus micaceus TaxID=71717 RepID=A0A4Y7T5M9_COPMI|nr:hypothetical protein FA13DRAFT_1711083 [Coprinellus micaceus]